MPKANMTPAPRRQVHYVPWRVLPATALAQVIAHIERLGEEHWPEVNQMRRRLHDLTLQEFEPANASMH